MASKLSRVIPPATPVLHVGSLRYFDRNLGSYKDLNVRALDFGSNRAWRRIEKNLTKQVANLELCDLLPLIAPENQWEIENDFYTLEMRKDRAYAMEQLRLYLVENYLCNELLRVAYDPTKPLPKLLPLLATQLLNAYELVKQKARMTLKQLRRIFRFSVFTPFIQLPQRSPNAPNTAPAFSLVAA